MPTQKINAAVSKLRDAIRSADNNIYSVRQRYHAENKAADDVARLKAQVAAGAYPPGEVTGERSNAYRQALKEATETGRKAIREAREGINKAVAEERQTLMRKAGPKSDNPAERALYATRAAALAQQGPHAVLNAVRQELAAGNKTAAQELLLVGRGQLQGIANALEVQQLQRAASDESTAAAQAALQGLDAFERELSSLDVWHIERTIDRLGEGDPDPAQGYERFDFGQGIGLWQTKANKVAGEAGDKAMAAYADAGTGKTPEPYAVDAEPDTADAEGEQSGADGGDSGEGAE